MLLGGIGVTRASLASDARSVKDGVYIGADSPLLALMGGAKAAPRAKSFLTMVERICESYVSTTAANRPQWFQHEFRAVCEAAVPVAAELSVRALTEADATPVNVTAFLDALSCHVSMATKEKLQKLQYTARMVGKRHEAPSSRATAGTPAMGRPTAMDFPASPGAASSMAVLGSPASAAEFPASVPAAVAPGAKRERPSGRDEAGGGQQQAQPPQPRPQAASEDGQPATTNATNAAASRPITSDKLNVIMPWTIPAPHQDGVVLRRVRPRTFKRPAGAGAGADADAGAPSPPSVQMVVEAAATPQVYELWLRREAALSQLSGNQPSSSSAAVADADDLGAPSPRAATAAAVVQPAPIFPHVAAHRGGLGGPSGIQEDSVAGPRHTTVRKSFLTALAHYGVHWVKRGSAAAVADPATAAAHAE